MRIVHISDIHFGKSLDTDAWKAAREAIISYKPGIIIVSGDMVDHPSIFLFLCVKSELEEICSLCSKETELVVAPGNHDVRLWGLFPSPLRQKAFEKVFFHNTAEIWKSAANLTGAPIKMSPDVLKSGILSSIKRSGHRRRIKRMIGKTDQATTSQSQSYHGNNQSWPTIVRHSHALVAAFDSNPAPMKLMSLATGEVINSQLTKLRGLLSQNTIQKHAFEENTQIDRELIRIAVLHHHPLPISLLTDSKNNAKKESQRERHLVLANSGNFIATLQDHDFDLILHGHKHRPQLARIEINLGPNSDPLIVLGSGSIANSSEPPMHNTIRFIETENNGRLSIFNIKNNSYRERIYQESILDLKVRLFRKAKNNSECSTA